VRFVSPEVRRVSGASCSIQGDCPSTFPLAPGERLFPFLLSPLFPLFFRLQTRKGPFCPLSCDRVERLPPPTLPFPSYGRGALFSSAEGLLRSPFRTVCVFPNREWRPPFSLLPRDSRDCYPCLSLLKSFFFPRELISRSRPISERYVFPSLHDSEIMVLPLFCLHRILLVFSRGRREARAVFPLPLWAPHSGARGPFFSFRLSR